MKRHHRVRRSPELELDEIYNSNDPEVRAYFDRAFMEEMDAARSRVILRVARKFQHMLPPRMQRVLSAMA